jgi:hypothetical protein
MVDTPQPQQGASSHADDPTGSEHPSGTVNPPLAPEWHPDEQEHRSKERKYWVATTILTAIAAIGAIASTILALQALRSSQDSVKAARDAVKEANRQAKSAEDQVAVAKDSEIKQTRAYVFLRDIRLERINETTFEIIPEWENTGNSETVNMSARVNFHADEVTLPDGFSFGDVPVGQPDAQIVLGPKSIANITFATVDQRCLSQFNRRDQLNKFYFWGWANYNDTVTNEQHVTRFLLGCPPDHIFSRRKKRQNIPRIVPSR